MNIVEYDRRLTHAQLQTQMIGPSPGIWKHCPWAEFNMYGNGITFMDDFDRFLAATGGWAAAGTGAATPVVINTVSAAAASGVVDILTGATDNNEIYLCGGNNLGGAFRITAGKKLWFEARVAPVAIVEQGLLVGLGIGGASAAVPADTLADNTGVCGDVASFIGFRAGMHASVMTVHGVYNTYTGAGSNEVTAVSGITVPVAGEWYKLGFYFDGRKCHWFADGNEAAANGSTHPVMSTATVFPDGVNLTIILGAKAGESVAKHLYADWVRVAMEKA